MHRFNITLTAIPFLLGIGLLLSCTSDIESSEDILNRMRSSSSSFVSGTNSSSSNAGTTSPSSDSEGEPSSSSDSDYEPSSSTDSPNPSSSSNAGTPSSSGGGTQSSPSGGGKPIVNGSITCDWPILSGNGTNKYLSIGADLPDCTGNVSIENPGEDDADCGEVTYETSGSTSAAGKVYGRAVATCSKSKVTLDEYEAEVVADPVLGACAWKDNKTVLAKGQEATPASTLSNSYGRCGKVEFSGGFPRVLTESDVGAVKVTASADCGDKGTVEKACPDLEVKIYELKKESDRVTLPNEATVIEMDFPSDWISWSSHVEFFCQADQRGDGKVSGTIGTGASAVSISGSYFATALIPLAWTTGKYSLLVDIKCSNSCSCGVRPYD